MLIADYVHDRLLLFKANCLWYDVTLSGGVRRPRGAVWLNGRLYVSRYVGYGANDSITMFE